MPIVVDASIALAALLPDEAREDARAALTRLQSEDGVAPAGWPIEIANGFLLAERRGRVTPAQTAALQTELRLVSVAVAPPPDEATINAVLTLAREHGLTAYDASYLELALRERAALATLDDALRDAARNAGVGIVGA